MKSLRVFLFLTLVFASGSVLRAQEDILQRRITLQLGEVTVGDALRAIERETGYEILYSSTLVDTKRRVTVTFRNSTLLRVLQDILGDAANGVRTEGKQIKIQPSPGKGSVQGTVQTSDGQAAGYVTVAIRGQRSVQANERGQFVLENIDAGTYTITATFVGLKPQQQRTTVTAGQVVQITFVLHEDAQTLQEVIVNGQQHTYGKPLPSPSLRIQTPIIKTPQSILSIGKQVLEDQQVFTMTDVARNVSGVTSIFPYVGIYTDFNIRGTRANANKLRNGMNTNGAGALQEDMSYVESVEFIKGPAGFMLAQGEPGGMYNVVTKKPLGYEHVSAMFTTGSYGLYRGSVDLGGHVGSHERLGYRLNVMKQYSGTHLDYGLNNRLSVAPVLTYQIDDRTSLTAEYNLDMAKVDGSFAQVPTRNRQFLRRSFTVEDHIADPMELMTQYGYLNLQHHINDQWKLTAQIGTQYADQDGFVFYTTAAIGADGLLPRNYRYFARRSTINTGQLFVNGNFRTGNVNHQLLLGVDGGANNSKFKFVDARNILPINVDKPVYGLAAGIDTLIDKSAYPWRSPNRVVWQAVSLQDDIAFTDWLQLTLGGRFTRYEHGGSTSVLVDQVFTPRAGLIIQPIPNTSVYLLYDESFVAQTGTNFAGERFKPISGNNVELGIKREWFAKRLLTQLAAYRIVKNNALTSDPDHLSYNIQRGQLQSRGFEFDAIGSVTPEFDLVVNYAFTDSKISKDTNPDVVGQRGQAPRHAYNLWAKYRIAQGMFNGLGFGFGGSYYKDQYGGWTIKKNPTDPEILVDYKSLNAAMSYQVGKLAFALNVDNLTDEFNIFGSFDYTKGANGEYTYIALPGTNWRLAVSYKF